jgi:hypothetical protein
MSNNILKQILTLFLSSILLSCSTGTTNDQKFNQENTDTKAEEQKKLSDKDPEVLLAIIQEAKNPPSERLVQDFAELLNTLKGYYSEMPKIDITNTLAKAYDISVKDGYKKSLLEFVQGFLHGVKNSTDNNVRHDYAQFLTHYTFYVTGRKEESPEILKYFDENLLAQDKLKEFLKREIETLNTPFVDDKPRIQLTDKVDDKELQDLSFRIEQFIWRATAIQQAESQLNEENKKLARTLRLKQVKRQEIEYPAIRSRYGQMMAATMWEYDQEIKVFGNGNSSISLTHPEFAEKETIKDVYSSLKAALIMYRFKKLIFSGYNGGKQTVIDLETPRDKELVAVNELQTK